MFVARAEAINGISDDAHWDGEILELDGGEDWHVEHWVVTLSGTLESGPWEISVPLGRRERARAAHALRVLPRRGRRGRAHGLRGARAPLLCRAMLSRHAALAALIAVLLALALAACGDDDDGGRLRRDEPSEPAQTEEAAAPEEKSAEISTNVEAKPEIGKPTGEPPTELVKEDIVKGKGPAVKEGDQITVDYVGVNYSTGDQFDASWDNGAPVDLPARARASSSTGGSRASRG